MNSFFCQNGCCKYFREDYVPQRTVFNRTVRNRRKAGVFVVDESLKKVLLVQSRGKLWGPPKGSLEEGETFQECAKRELYEETGLVVPESCYDRQFSLKTNAVYYYATACSRSAEIRCGDVNDANGIGWFDIDCVASSVRKGDLEVNQHLRLAFRTFLGISLQNKSA
jgi:8-oxo-dGTP pyrophosphatase MutT (NUDIX family)